MEIESLLLIVFCFVMMFLGEYPKLQNILGILLMLFEYLLILSDPLDSIMKIICILSISLIISCLIINLIKNR